MNGALAGVVILAIGDSHLVHMVSPFTEALEAQGAAVNAYGMCGTMPADWLSKGTTQCLAERHDNAAAMVKTTTQPTWLLSDLIDKNHPNLIVVELGDNLGDYGTATPLPRDLIAEQVKQFLGPIKARQLPCVWIGPPFGADTPGYHKTDARVRELSQYLAQIVAPCSYVDTTAFAPPGEFQTIDGVHLTSDSYRKWSAGIAQAIVRLSGTLHLAHAP
jgi:lysophospholipase L1-like esterase